MILRVSVWLGNRVMLVFECLVIPHSGCYIFLTEDVMTVKSIKFIDLL